MSIVMTLRGTQKVFVSSFLFASILPTLEDALNPELCMYSGVVIFATIPNKSFSVFIVQFITVGASLFFMGYDVI